MVFRTTALSVCWLFNNGRTGQASSGMDGAAAGAAVSATREVGGGTVTISMARRKGGIIAIIREVERKPEPWP